jgi:type II secretory pathway pseudopilin PulG
VQTLNSSSRGAAVLRTERGQGLVEVLISLTFLAVAVAALLTLMTAGALSLQRAGKNGTAMTLAEKQLELYRTLAYTNIRLYHVLPTSGTYVTANSTDPNIPAATGCATGSFTGCEVIDSTNGEIVCPNFSIPTECQASRTVPPASSPDHRSYRVDTYITYFTPVSGATTGRQTKKILVIVRDASAAGTPILARVGSSFDASNGATG